MPGGIHLIEEWTVSLLDASPLGLASSCDFDHRLDVHPRQLTPLYHLDSDLKVRRRVKQKERRGATYWPQESETSGPAL